MPGLDTSDLGTPGQGASGLRKPGHDTAAQATAAQATAAQDTYFEIEVAADKIRMFHRQAGQSFVATLFAGLVWVGVMWGEASHVALMGWLTAFSTLIICRLVLFMQYQRMDQANASVFRWFQRYSVLVVCSSMVWGVGTVWIVHNNALLSQVTTFVFLVSLSGSSLVAYGLFPRLTLVVITALLVPIVLHFTFSGSVFAHWLALGGFLLAASTIRSVFSYGKQIEDSFRQTYQLREANRIAQWHAETDMLTGLKNRRAFTVAAEALMKLAVRDNQPVAILVIDLDHFKEINDSFGHSVGDSLLVHVAGLMQVSLRRSDICGRFGGDEFVILLPGTSLEAAQTVAEKIRALAMQTTVDLDGLDVSVCLSIGIACGGEEGFDSLVRRADHAMYQAKRNGRNRIVVTPVM